MKITITVILVVIMFLLLSKTTITLKPFKISFDDIGMGLGWLFLVLAAICFQVSGYNTGNIEGYKEALHDVIENAKHNKNIQP